MSGGVDSSVTAGLLARAGYDCTGVFMCFGQPARKDGGHKACCSPDDARDARSVAECLGIKFAVLNFQHDLEQIVDYFVSEYRLGRTPNPCIMCNSSLKFGKLLDYASALGIEKIATGHYARIRKNGGSCRLARGLDFNKDQSYALFNIERAKLARILLPLGEYSKPEVRRLAGEMNLPVRDKPESQEICFVGDDDYAALVADRIPELRQSGDIVDSSGKKLGEHDGFFHFTIGQRRGLGVAMGVPWYVVNLDAKTNTVVLGPKSELMKSRLHGDRVNWLIDPEPPGPFKATVQIRYNHRGAPATVTPVLDENGTPGPVTVDFDSPVPAITPGQAAVFYDPDANVIGGAWINAAE
jgi:tRNA-specific 2-thiouridylase